MKRIRVALSTTMHVVLSPSLHLITVSPLHPYHAISGITFANTARFLTQPTRDEIEPGNALKFHATESAVCSTWPEFRKSNSAAAEAEGPSLSSFAKSTVVQYMMWNGGRSREGDGRPPLSLTLSLYCVHVRIRGRGDNSSVGF